MNIRTLSLLGLVGVLGLAGAVEAGRIPGPGIDTRRCEAYSSVTYHDTFRGGELAVVSIVGDGDTDLDVFVYDRFGNLIVQGIGLTDRETVRWVPRSTGTYRIVVRNLGGVWNRYSLATN
ncbi:MAG: hypothetical protein FJ271_31700 [Planctomycetes bacterium]|nr:hypothetical protein [Planctomycetota bacterium]